jgi:hypothetical protein
MIYSKNGSLVLTVLLAISISLVITLAGWHSLAQLQLLAAASSSYQKERSLVEGLLNTAISYCLEQAGESLNLAYDQQSWQLHYDPWPAGELVGQLGHYVATLLISIKNKEWHITGFLQKNGVVLHTGSCSLRPFMPANVQWYKPMLLIDDWTIK